MKKTCDRWSKIFKLFVEEWRIVNLKRKPFESWITRLVKVASRKIACVVEMPCSSVAGEQPATQSLTSNLLLSYFLGWKISREHLRLPEINLLDAQSKHLAWWKRWGRATWEQTKRGALNEIREEAAEWTEHGSNVENFNLKSEFIPGICELEITKIKLLSDSLKFRRLWICGRISGITERYLEQIGKERLNKLWKMD